jgi:hypothetical protein
MMINNYLFGKFGAGHLTRLGIVGIIELIKNAYKICRQHLNRLVKMIVLEILH